MSNINVKNAVDNGNGLIDLQVYSDGSVGVTPQNSDRLPVADRAPAPPGNSTASSLKLGDGTVAAIGAVTEGQVLTLVDGVIVGGEGGGGGSDISAALVAATRVEAGHKGTITGISVRAATTSNLTGFTPAGAGPGKTLTKSSNGALVLDGVTLDADDLVLIKNEGSEDHIHRGLYVVTDPGSVSTPWILTRSTLLDTDEKFQDCTGKSIAMSDEGSTQGGNWYRFSVSNAGGGIDDAATPVFTEFSGPVTIDGNGITPADGKTLPLNGYISIVEHGDETVLTIRQIPDGSFMKREGTDIVGANPGGLVGDVTETKTGGGALSLTAPVTVFSGAGAFTLGDGLQNGQDKWVRNPVDQTISSTLGAGVAGHIQDPASGVILTVNFANPKDYVHLKWDLATTSWHIVDAGGVTFTMDI